MRRLYIDKSKDPGPEDHVFNAGIKNDWAKRYNKSAIQNPQSEIVSKPWLYEKKLDES